MMNTEIPAPLVPEKPETPPAFPTSPGEMPPEMPPETPVA